MTMAIESGSPPSGATAATWDQAATLKQAVNGASHKLARLLDSTLGRLHDHREKASGLPLSGTDPAPS